MAYHHITSANASLSFVGTNNALPLFAYRQNNEIRYAILLNGKVYKDIFAVIGTYTANTDPAKGMVFCDFVDSKAGDVLEQALKKAYP